MSLQPSKYKSLAKQVYNHLSNEYGNSDMNLKFIMHHIKNDELLTLLLQNANRIGKIKIAFLVYFYSLTKDIDISYSKVDGKIINIGMYRYSDLGTRMDSCDECGGSGNDYCSECDGSGTEYCDNCDGNGEVECRNCDGSGEVDGEDCSDCGGSGNVECNVCDGDGKLECSSCEGYGSVSCDYCDGDGEYESNDDYYTEEEIDYFGLNGKLSDLPEDTFLNDNQIDYIFDSKPYYAEHTTIDDKVESSIPGKQFKGDAEGDTLLVINNFYEI